MHLCNRIKLLHPRLAAAADSADAAAVADAAPPAAAPPAAAAEPAPAASPPARPPAAGAAAVDVVLVSKGSSAKRVGGYIVASLNDRPDGKVLVKAVGPQACGVAARALAYARDLLLSTRRVGVQFQPEVSVERGGAAGGAAAGADGAGGDAPRDGPDAARRLKAVIMWASVAAVDASDAPATDQRPLVLRVGAGTPPFKLAAKIADEAASGAPLQLRCVGRAAVSAALRALATARVNLIVEGAKDLAVSAELEAAEDDRGPAGGGAGGGSDSDDDAGGDLAVGAAAEAGGGTDAEEGQPTTRVLQVRGRRTPRRGPRALER